MRRLITYLDALFVGIVLGLIFVTFVHATPGPKAKMQVDGVTFPHSTSPAAPR